MDERGAAVRMCNGVSSCYFPRWEEHPLIKYLRLRPVGRRSTYIQ
jgi:hypothetical protein